MAILPKRVVQEMEAYQRPSEGRLNYIRLDFNENTTGFPELYPDGMPDQWISAYPEYDLLSERVADLFGVESANVLLANGSDEGIAVIAQTFIEPKEDVAIVSKPCFSMIPHSLKLAGATLKEVPVLDDLSFNIEGIEQALQDGAKVAMFASPENPTGSMIEHETILTWCKQYPDILFAIDEAYVEFAPSSIVSAVPSYENLVVLRTFSKAWGIAGLRLGFVIAPARMIDYMFKVRQPYNVNNAAIWTALKLIEKKDEIFETARDIVARKKSLVQELKKRKYRVVDRHSNSILISVGINAQDFTDYCRDNGVLIRNRTNAWADFQLDGKVPESKQLAAVGNDQKSGSRHDYQSAVTEKGCSSIKPNPMWGKVRVSLGNVEENKRFVDLVDSFNESYGVIFDLDGTLIDTSKSFDETIRRMVLKYSGKPLADSELSSLRLEGGFNDDWVATRELLKRRGFAMPSQAIVKEATELYLQLAPENEIALFDHDLLPRISERHPIFIVTGRTRPEYNPVWHERLSKMFKHVHCLGDVQGKAPKPSPDCLMHLIEEFNLKSGVYIGNSVDDMWSARDAGLARIGITTTLSSSALKEAGAQLTLNSVNELTQVFAL